ncbi:MAG: hypothetical protein ABSG68_08305, partial [Thermoguttaceae bacterium]
MNLLAFIAPWLWWSLLAVGFVASLAGLLAWYFREVSQRRLPAPRFFLIALVVHVLLAIGSFYVYLDNGAGAQIRRTLHQIVAASGLPLEKLRESLRPADEGFGQVADLRSVTTESPAASPNLAARPPLLPAGDMTAPLEPLGRMLPAARFAAPPGEAIAGLDLRDMPHRRGAAAVAVEPIEIEPLRAVAQPSAPRIEGVAVGEDRAAAAGAPPAARPAMLTGPASEPLTTAAGSPGKGAPAGFALNDFAPLTVAEVPRLNRTVRPVPPVLPDFRADMEALAAAAGGSGNDAGSGSGDGPGQRAGASPGSVDVARPDLPAAPAPRASPGGLAGSGDVAALAEWSRRLGRGSAGGGIGGDDDAPGAVAPLGTASGTPSGDRLARRGPRAATLMYAEDNIGLQAM